MTLLWKLGAVLAVVLGIGAAAYVKGRGDEKVLYVSERTRWESERATFVQNDETCAKNLRDRDKTIGTLQDAVARMQQAATEAVTAAERSQVLAAAAQRELAEIKARQDAEPPATNCADAVSKLVRHVVELNGSAP